MQELVTPQWKDLIKRVKSLVLVYKELCLASGFFYFAAYMRSKLQTSKGFKKEVEETGVQWREFEAIG